MEEYPPLLPLEVIVHPLGDLVLQRDELVLLDQGLQQQEQSGFRLFPLQQLLSAVGAYHEIGGRHVHHLLGIADRLQGGLGFLGQLWGLAHIVGELPYHRVHQRPQARLPLGGVASTGR